MKSQTRHFFLGLALTAVVLFGLSGSAGAQSQDPSTTQQPSTSPGQALDQVPPPIPPRRPAELKPAYWSAIAGFEADTHDTGYGFVGPQYVKPIQPNLAWIVGANLNYLYYDFPNTSGQTNVRAPGFAARGGVKFGDRNYVELSAGPGVKFRHTEVVDPLSNVIRSTSDTLVGLDVGGDLSVDPTSHNNISGIVDYNTIDSYTWSRLAYKEQVGNPNWSGRFTPYVGVEFVGQGNADIRSTQYGAFVEVVHVPSRISVMVRGGYKRSTFEIGPAQTGPWVAVGFYQRLR